MSGPTRRWRPTLWIIAIATVAALAAGTRQWALRTQALEEVAALLPAPSSGPADVARVWGSIRKLSLVTVEIATDASAESSEESWRGDVHARVAAPVKLHFGTDLSRLRAESVRANTIGNSWVVVVPPPERIATEVFGEREQTDVSVGWLRSRSMSGEKHLGEARRDLYEAARRLRLSSEDEQLVRARTREQVGTLVRAIVGPFSSVTVRFEDEVGPITMIGADGERSR